MRTGVLVLAVALAVPAVAQNNGDCRNAEYAQYRDRAKTQDGLELMARDFCVNRIMSGNKRLPRCVEGNEKMADAAKAEGATPQFQAMTADYASCVETANRLRARGLIE